MPASRTSRPSVSRTVRPSMTLRTCAGADHRRLAARLVVSLRRGCEQRGEPAGQQPRDSALSHSPNAPSAQSQNCGGMPRPSRAISRGGWNARAQACRARASRRAASVPGSDGLQDGLDSSSSTASAGLDLVARHAMRAPHPDRQIHGAHFDQRVLAGFDRGGDVLARSRAPITHNAHTPTPTPFHRQDAGSCGKGVKENRRSPSGFSGGAAAKQATHQRGGFFRAFGACSSTRRTSVFMRTSLRRRCSSELGVVQIIAARWRARRLASNSWRPFAERIAEPRRLRA